MMVLFVGFFWVKQCWPVGSNVSLRFFIYRLHHEFRPCHGAESHLAISSGAGLRAGWEPYLRLLGSKSSSGSLAPMDTIFGFGSGSAALAPREPFHYINPLNFFVCIFHVSPNFKKYIFLKKILSLWDDKDRQALFAFLQPMCGSRSQSWKWELKAENSAPIELVRSRSHKNGSGYSRFCVRAIELPWEPNGS